MEMVETGFTGIAQGWVSLWTGLERFWEIFSSWLPVDITTAAATCVVLIISLACWRLFK